MVFNQKKKGDELVPTIAQFMLDLMRNIETVQRETAITYGFHSATIVESIKKAEDLGLSDKAWEDLALLLRNWNIELDEKSKELGVDLRRFSWIIQSETPLEVPDQEWEDFKNLLSGDFEIAENHVAKVVKNRAATVFLRQLHMTPENVTNERFQQLNFQLELKRVEEERAGTAVGQKHNALEIELELWAELKSGARAMKSE